ncbi:hypothetical protein [Nostoc sp.]|uniref:hypothetical protein n=1 Tax=Nostoc sp. TaxID=1180 RepID=UPI002FF7692E
MGIGHWALGMGHGAWGMGHWAWGIGLGLTQNHTPSGAIHELPLPENHSFRLLFA